MKKPIAAGSRCVTCLAVLAGLLSVPIVTGSDARAHDEPNGRPHHKGSPANPTAVMRAFMNTSQAAQSAASEQNLPCIDGTAGSYPCDNIDLLAFAPLAEIGGDHNGSAANDIWGWTDPVTGREYALFGRVFGMSVVDITHPINPVYVGQVFTHDSVGSSWRDIKVYQDHAFIVSEADGHGMQVFDLAGLRTLDPAGMPFDFVVTARYTGFGSAHNLVINEATGFAYGVGTDTCSGGLHMVDIGSPASPVGAGCFSSDGYTHDAQCVIYNGPDADYTGREICFAANEDTLTIVDVTNKSNPSQISRTGYPGRGYTHQGWLSEDHSRYLLDDELDERNFGHNTRTRIWNVDDLDAPAVLSVFEHATPAIDHNIYVKGDWIFQANYRAGLSILDGSAADIGVLNEIGYFDVYPSSDSAFFNGAWSNFPFFDSDVVIISGIEQGLFVVLPDGVDFISLAGPIDGAAVSGLVAIDIKAQSAVDAAADLLVEWRVDGGDWEAAAYNAATDTFEALWDSTAASAGDHTIVASMTDLGDATTLSRSITVSTTGPDPDDQPPTVSFDSPADGATVSGNVRLVASADDDGAVAGVEFFDGATKLGDASFNGSTWTMRSNFKKAAPGDHVLTARATDNANPSQSTDATITVTVGGDSGGGGGGNGGPKCHPKRSCPDP